MYHMTNLSRLGERPCIHIRCYSYKVHEILFWYDFWD
jgi:hypothetical protein